VSSTTLTKKALRLRLQAARVGERTLVEQVRRAYGTLPEQAAELPADDPLVVGEREKAQASLVNRGLLSHEELATLTAGDATSIASQRLRDEIASLQDELAKQPTRSDSIVKPPRTLRR
jgi:hypothetical protein